MTLKIITHPVFALHPVPMGHPERPDRIRTVWQAIEAGFSDIDQLEAPLGIRRPSRWSMMTAILNTLPPANRGRKKG